MPSAPEELERERYLALITDSLPALVSYVGADGRYRFVNHSYERFFGHSRDEIRGKHLREVLGEATWDLIRPYVERVLRGERVDYEARLPYQYGGARDVVASYIPSARDDGTVEGFIVFVNDVTERKRLENELHAAEHRIAGVLDTVREGYLTIDDEWRITYFNAEAERYFARKRTETVGRSLLDAFPQIRESAFEKAYRQAFATKEPVVLQSRGAVYPDRYLETRVYPALDGGLAIFFRDVSDAHRAAETLRENSEKTKLALRAASAGAWWWYEDGVVEWSDEVFALLGVDPERAPSFDLWLSIIHPEDVSKAAGAARAALEARQPLELEFRVLRRDGSVRWLSALATPLEMGGRWGMVGITQDVTSRRESEEAIRRSERRYRTLVGTTTAVVWRANANGEFIEPQDRWTAYTGQDWPAHARFGWMEMIHPDDRNAIEAQWREAVASRRDLDVEGRVWHAPSESYRAFIGRATVLLRDDGSVDEWIGMMHDIDDRRHAATAMRVLAAADYALAGSLDPETTLRNVCNVVVDAFADWCYVAFLEEGVPRVAAARHRDPAKAATVERLRHELTLTPENAPVLFETLRSATSQLYPRIAVSSHPGDGFDIIRELGVESVICAPLTARGGPPGALVCVSARGDRRYGERDRRVALDLANRASVALENARLYEASQAATRAKDEFLAVVSHELRTPMTSILGWTGLLKLGTPDHETIGLAIDAITTAAKAQAAIVDDLLEVSRIITGKLRIEPQITTVVEAVKQAVETVASAAEAKGVHIETKTSGAVSLVRGDPARLQQVFWNLLSNAVKFTNQGGSVSIEISHQPLLVRVAVRDTGCGIAPEFLPHVFDRFAQEQNAASRSHAGLGLGLSIAKSIVELHGGTIDAMSDGVGKGATFTVSIPAPKTAIMEDLTLAADTYRPSED